MALGEYERLTKEWEAQNDSNRNLSQALTQPLRHYDVLAQVTTLSTTSTVSSTYVLSFPTVRTHPALEAAVQDLNAVLQREPLMDNVRAAFIRLGLNRPYGQNKSPLDQLEASRRSLELPSMDEGSPVAVLISLRGSIDDAVAALLRHCPMPEEQTRGIYAKIISIGQRCGKAGKPFDFFCEVATSAKRLHQTFSEAKQPNQSREQLILLFNEGLLFLQTFLDCLDETKLRP
jgi:hypothetical protein